MKPISYEQARELIKDGDLVSILRPHKNPSLIARIINSWCKSPIYHTGILIWLSPEKPLGQKRLFIVEAADKYRQILPLSIYKDNPMHVLAKPDNVKFELFCDSLVERVGVAEYSYIKAIQAGVRQYFKLPAIALGTGEYCSELAAKLWKMGGLNIDDTELNPCELEKTLVEKYNIEYRCWVD